MATCYQKGPTVMCLGDFSSMLYYCILATLYTTAITLVLKNNQVLAAKVPQVLFPPKTAVQYKSHNATGYTANV